MRYENLPPEITALPQWVCVWNNSKIPMRANIKKGASSVQPDTWSTFEDAKNAVESGMYDHLGFVFNNNGIVGIDIDCGFDDDGFLSQVSIDIMRSCRSYTEVSRSGRGVHIFLKGKLPFKGKNNRAGVEIYESSRYFIVTGQKLIYDTIIENQQAIDYIVEKYFALNHQYGMKQFLVPYLMSSHPGSTMQEAVKLAEYIRDMGYNPEQVQDFYPTPSTLSTVMYYTGLDPRTMEKVYVPTDPHEKAMQRALIQYRDPKNYYLVREALLKAHREDLIGSGPKCLIRAVPPRPGKHLAPPPKAPAKVRPARGKPVSGKKAIPRQKGKSK